MKRRLGSLLLLALPMGFAHADNGAKPEYPKYDCPGANTESEMTKCVETHLKKSDAELNLAYQALLARYKDNGVPAHLNIKSQDVYLQKAQKAWIAFRDESCNLETYEAMGGSGFGTISTECLLKYTQERTAYLKGLLGNP